MIVRPRQPTDKLGRKNIAAATTEQLIAIYRSRFAPLADNVDLIVEGAKNDVSGTVEAVPDDGLTQSEDVDDAGESGPTDSGMVESDASVDITGPGGPSVSGDSPDERASI